MSLHRIIQRAIRVWMTMGVALAAANAAHAQYYLPNQDGRLFDQNPYLLGDGSNYARPVSPLFLGNAAAGGTLGRGQSLRINTIPDPSALRTGVGSGALSAFRRDSVSVGDASRPLGGLAGGSYFDPSLTARSAGFLQGYPGGPQNPLGPNTSQFGSLTAPDLRTDLRAPAYAPTDPSITNLYTGTQRQLTSSVFGLRPPSINTLSQWDRGTASGLAGIDPNRPAQFSTQPYPQQGIPRTMETNDPLLRPIVLDRVPPIDTRTPPGSRSPFGVQDDPARSNAPLAIQTPVGPAGNEFPTLDLSSRFEPPRQVGSFAARPSTPQSPAATPPDESPAYIPRLTESSMLPGNDLFTDMRIALELTRDPRAAWFNEMQTAIRTNPALAESLHERAKLESERFIAAVKDQPIRSFYGGTSSALNNEILKAESLMEIGHYSESVDRFATAHRLDPSNPLPLLGMGHAQLAAGEYLTAVTNILRGIERFPELTKFSFDLTALLGGGETVDIRRAELMQRLAQFEDPRLRFLLGYIEFHTGNRESGLEHLERAAREDRSGSTIRRYPSMLKGQGALPPPNPVPPSESGLPTMDLPPLSPRSPAPPGARAAPRHDAPAVLTPEPTMMTPNPAAASASLSSPPARPTPPLPRDPDLDLYRTSSNAALPSSDSARVPPVDLARPAPAHASTPRDAGKNEARIRPAPAANPAPAPLPDFEDENEAAAPATKPGTDELSIPKPRPLAIPPK